MNQGPERRINLELRGKINDAAVEIVGRLKRRVEDGGVGTSMDRGLIEKPIHKLVQAFGESVLDDKEELFRLVKDQLMPRPQQHTEEAA